MREGPSRETENGEHESAVFRAGEVAVVGRPNAGKSTLVNRLVGEKVAIVSDKPQTTRKRILGIARRPGVEIALVDTPGIHRPDHRMNAAMLRDATDALSTADLVLLVVDAAEGGKEGRVLDLLSRTGRPVFLALNKIDLVPKTRLLPMIAEFAEARLFREIVPISAKTGDGVERLADLLAASLPEGPAAYPEDFLSSTSEADWAAEVIREKLLERTRQELPFASAVVVERMTHDEERDVTVVYASIVVEKEGQKGIVIGRGGSMIRDIGKAAREELEQRSGGRWFLDLNVKVRADWRDDERFLARVVADPPTEI
ncbi:MAG TPA: GTPase Era [Thermoanaerobaculia bacterium]|nr:GTPase Era [Thermoanaerobaculia bacterium]